ncbi:sulfite exporter TauE/SafE family protein [Cellvibrio sp. NN19]|uniref:sulfite exporter TauE/SafE family protein n=1 Tax=Cellvibrio chitinivorans TaxID=3102792 RepID=UPI002B407642|nr:sulfite exporter TauE/SafE family protein [Cellvibrio sp. NN19]
MIIPKLIGVAGLLTIPASIMSAIIFAIISVYSITYILNKPFKSSHPVSDGIFLSLGAYISGTSLIGAPLIMSVYMAHVAREKLRDTLFVLWFILVCIKMVAFLIAGVDLQLQAHLWLLPAAFVGHFFGLKFHKHLVNADPVIFYRVIGCALLVVSLFGLVAVL